MPDKVEYRVSGPFASDIGDYWCVARDRFFDSEDGRRMVSTVAMARCFDDGFATEIVWALNATTKRTQDQDGENVLRAADLIARQGLP